MNNIFRLFFVSFLFFHLLLPAQNGQPVFPKAINNAKTTKHKQVPGTRVSLIPPVGFNNAVAFTGMESKDASIHVLDFPGKNYFKTSAGMAKDSFEKRGVTVFEFYEFQFNGFPAKFMHLAGDNHQKTGSKRLDPAGRIIQGSILEERDGEETDCRRSALNLGTVQLEARAGNAESAAMVDDAVLAQGRR